MTLAALLDPTEFKRLFAEADRPIREGDLVRITKPGDRHQGSTGQVISRLHVFYEVMIQGDIRVYETGEIAPCGRK